VSTAKYLGRARRAPRGRMIAALLATAHLFLAATAGYGQEKPPQKDPKRAGPAKAKTMSMTPIDPKIIDPKTVEDPKAAAAAAALLESAYGGQRPPEAVRMLAAILRGSDMGPGDGWFGPSEIRYSWKWLASRCGVDAKISADGAGKASGAPPKAGAGPASGVGEIPRSSFRGPDEAFARLDRNKDGVITPDDFDWSDRNRYVQMSQMTSRLFRKLNGSANGRLTKEDLLRFFDKAAGGKDYLSADDFRDALLEGLFGSPKPGDAPTIPMLVRGLFAGELGSMNEGPKLNSPAPDFALKTVDGKQSVQLSKLLGAKPVVLVFGSFT
jgi:hypothetical protein